MHVIRIIIFQAVAKLIQIIQLVMMARAILSWNPRFRGSRIEDILYQLTEPFIYPVRQLIEKTGAFRGSMFDFSFLATFLLLSIIPNLLAKILF